MSVVSFNHFASFVVLEQCMKPALGILQIFCQSTGFQLTLSEFYYGTFGLFHENMK